MSVTDRIRMVSASPFAKLRACFNHFLWSPVAPLAYSKEQPSPNLKGIP